MNGLANKLLTAVAAMAIFVVGATCTQAGCLLSLTGAAPVRTEMHKACCSTAGHDAPSGQDGNGKSCPLCTNPVLLAKGADQAAAGGDVPVLALAFASPVSRVHSTLIAHTPAGSDELAFVVPPSTLVALHCALLT